MSLNKALELAYVGMVMGRGEQLNVAHEVLQEAHKADQTLLSRAEDELARCEAVKDRCFVSKTHAEFLRQAIPQLLATPTSKKEDEMTSKLKGLADLGKSYVSDVENRAAASIDRLAKGKDKANSALDKFDSSVTASIEQSATELENFANQISNGPPTE